MFGGIVMKKFLCILLACLFVVVSSSLAEGKLSVVQKNVHIAAEKTFFFAKVVNEGDAEIGYNDGKLVIFDKNDELIIANEYARSIPYKTFLKPQEYTYIMDTAYDKLAADNLGDVKFSVKSTERGYKYDRVESSVEVTPKTDDEYQSYFAKITFTNTLEKMKGKWTLAFAATDKEGNIWCVDHTTLDDVAVHPGSTVTVSIYLDRDLVMLWPDYSELTFESFAYYIEE